MKILAIDIGGTAIKCALVDQKGNILKKQKYNAYFDEYQTPLIQTFKNALVDFYTNLEDKDIEGIALSVTGDVDSNKCYLVNSSGSIPDWWDIDFKKICYESLGKDYPITMLNDANAAALAEAWIGAAKDKDNAIVYTIGTGIGGGIIVDGKVLNGARGFAGNIGHMVIDKNGLKCHCGNNGCFEKLASTRALLKAAKRLGFMGEGAELFEQAKQDKQLKELLESFYELHGIALGSLIHIFNPECIVIGGGISMQGEHFLKAIKSATQRHCLAHFFEGIEFCIATLNNDAGVIGASKYFLDRLKK